MLNGRNGGERETGMDRAMARQRGLTGNKKPPPGVTLVTDAFFTPNWSEIKIS